MQKTGPNENCDMTLAIRRRSNCKRDGFHSHRKLNLLLKEHAQLEKHVLLEEVVEAWGQMAVCEEKESMLNFLALGAGWAVKDKR